MTTHTISTHVLDTSLGRPAQGVYVILERVGSHGTVTPVGSGTTDADGRIADLLSAGGSLEAGTYRLSFATGPYFAATNRETFYPEVVIHFSVASGASQRYHVPLLVSPFGFTTYRGS